MSIGSVTDNSDGTYRAQVTGVLAGTATILRASIGGAALTSAAPSLTVTPGAYDLARSTVTVASTQIASGTSTLVTLTPRDPAGNLVTTGTFTVTFATAGGTSTGTFGTITRDPSGTWSTQFTGQLAGGPTAISGSIDGSVVTSNFPTIQVQPGALSLATSTLSATANTLVSGAAATVVLVSRDAAGNPLGSGGRTVVFSHAGGTSSGSFGAVTDNGDGSYTAAFTAVLAGTATTLGAAIDGSAITSPAPSVTVTPGSVSLSTSQITVGSPTVVIGSTTSITLTTRDAAGNLLGAGGLTVAFTLSGGTSAGTIGAVTDNGNGTYSATFSATGAGTAVTVNGSLNGANLTSTLPTITVGLPPPSPATSVLTVSAVAVLSGSQGTITLTTRDASNNPITTGGAAVTFAQNTTATSSTGLIGPVVDNGNGTYSASFTGQKSGGFVTLTATLDGAAVTSTAQIAVNPGPFSASMSTLTTLTPVVRASTAAADASQIVLTPKDAWGNLIVNSFYTLGFAYSGGTSTGVFGAQYKNPDGSYYSAFHGRIAGTPITMSVSVNGTPVTSPGPAVTVVAGRPSSSKSTYTLTPSTVPSGTTATARFVAVDAWDNSCTGQTMGFGFPPPTQLTDSSGTFSAPVEGPAGTYTSTFTAARAGAAADVGVLNSSVWTFGGQVTVTGGAPVPSKSVLSVSRSQVRIGARVIATMKTFDAYGNQAGIGGATVTMAFSGGTSAGTLTPVVDNNDGSYTSFLEGTAIGTPSTLSGLVNGTAIAGPSVTVTATGGVDLSQTIDMLAYAGQTSTAGKWFSTLTSLDTNDFDGTVTYEIDAAGSTTDSASHNVQIRDETNALKASFTIAANGSGSVRSTFSPTPGAHTYHLYVSTSVATAGKLIYVRYARINVRQVGASKTRIWYPLAHGPDYPWVTADTGNFGGGSFRKVSSRFERLSGATPWTFEVVTSGSASLYNRTKGGVIGGTTVSATTGTELKTISFPDNAPNFDEGDVIFASGIIQRAGVWVRLDPLDHGEVCLFDARGSAPYPNSTDYSVGFGNLISKSRYSNLSLQYQAEATSGISYMRLWWCSANFFACVSTTTQVSSLASGPVRAAATLPSNDPSGFVSHGANSGGFSDRIRYGAVCASFY